MVRNWEVCVKGGAVTVADAAELAMHGANETGNDIETKTTALWTRADGLRGVDETIGFDVAPNTERKARTKIANADADGGFISGFNEKLRG